MTQTRHLPDGMTPRALAGVKMLERTGAKTFTIRYQDDEQPVIWCASVTYADGRAEASGALTPERAIMRLLETLIDGGTCRHCHKPTGFSGDTDPMPMDNLVCWYQYDPELEVIRRGCEGH